MSHALSIPITLARMSHSLIVMFDCFLDNMKWFNVLIIMKILEFATCIQETTKEISRSLTLEYVLQNLANPSIDNSIHP